MQKDIEMLVDKLINTILCADEICALREFAGKWGCDIGNCDKCEALAIKIDLPAAERERRKCLNR